MVEIDKIRELVTMMVEHELTEVELRDGEECVVIKRGSPPQAAPVVAIAPAVPSVTPPSPASQAAPSAVETGPVPTEGLLTIRSPMVGTFYASPDPDASSFVSIGSPVEPDTIVCIIEAMKVFNEIKAEVSGVVERILVKDEQAVEFGQPIIMVRPK